MKALDYWGGQLIKWLFFTQLFLGACTLAYTAAHIVYYAF